MIVGKTARKHVKFEYGRNIASTNIEVIDSDDKRLQLDCRAFLSNGNLINVLVGDGGEVEDKSDKKRKGKAKKQADKSITPNYDKRTVYFKVETKKELILCGLAMLRKHKYTGLKGHFTGYLQPFVEVGNAVEFKDRRYNSEADGTYLVQSVKVSFGQNGARREIGLGIKLD